jgi:hypothetical protein
MVEGDLNWMLDSPCSGYGRTPFKCETWNMRVIELASIVVFWENLLGLWGLKSVCLEGFGESGRQNLKS